MLIIIGTVLCVAALVVDRLHAWSFARFEDTQDSVLDAGEERQP